jgi:hypothetical protein
MKYNQGKFKEGAIYSIHKETKLHLIRIANLDVGHNLSLFFPIQLFVNNVVFLNKRHTSQTKLFTYGSR